MRFVGFATLMLAAVPAAGLTAQDTKDEVVQPITKAEIGAKLDSDYADMDGDKDGKVTAAEIESRLAKSAAAKIEAIKKERDAAFARLDANSDGNISKAEFEEKAKLPTAKAPDAKPFLARFDADKDGGITLDEFRTPTLANFSAMDANKDGTLTPAEAKGAIAAAAPANKAGAPARPARKPTFKDTPPIGR